MLTLIAESKTMSPCGDEIHASDLRQPLLYDRAAEVMRSLRTADAAYLSNAVKISGAMAGRLQRMIYDFPNKTTGEEAITAFTGVVFRALDYSSLQPDARKRIADGVRIISSLYGWLRPTDIVKPYRFDFTTTLAPGATAFAVYWRDAVTACLLDDIAAGRHTDVVDLLPGDASRCIDWKRVRANASVWKMDFKEMQPGGTVRTPNSNRLKTLRGQLLRRIATDNLASPQSIADRLADDFLIQTTPGLLTLTAVAL